MKQKFPEFETKRLFLRELRLSDAKSYEKYFADYEVVQYLSPEVPWPYSKEEATKFFQRVFPVQGKSRWDWGICLKEQREELIGCVSLYRNRINRGNRGFWLARKHWRKGLMTEAVQPVLNYAFKHLGFDKMIFKNAVQNKASGRIKEKTACRYIGIRSQKFLNPLFKKSEIWELTKEDWFKFYNK